MKRERLQKVLAHAGIASRRRAEEMILAGRVAVDGVVTTTLGVRVDPDKQRITVDGKPVGIERRVTYLLHKPVGTLSTVHDPQGRRTVRDLLKDVKARVYPVGRLDADTSGVLLLTNDGELSFRLTHPSFEVHKTYHARVRGAVDDLSLDRLAKGVELEDGPTAPAHVRLLWRRREESGIELRIHEGRNRQVRRMCDAVGHPVLELVRVRFAFLGLGSLSPGAYRLLTDDELRRLRRLVDLTGE